jgi:hypothetical protein
VGSGVRGDVRRRLLQHVDERLFGLWEQDEGVASGVDARPVGGSWPGVFRK